MWDVFGHFFVFLSRIVFAVAVAVLVYVVMTAGKNVFKVYQQLLLMWSIAIGNRWMPKWRSMRIQPFFCRCSDLDDISVEDCFYFHSSAFDTVENNYYVTEEKLQKIYHKQLRSHSHVLFCRDGIDGSLRGMVTFDLQHKGTYTTIGVGTMLAYQHYHCGSWMRLALAYLVLKELTLHPRTPLYIIGKLSTYKAYLTTTQLPEIYPRYNKGTPEAYKTIAENFLQRHNIPMEKFDRDTFVLQRRFGMYRKLAPSISEQESNNPHIRFFSQCNPGWTEGDQLVTMVKMTWPLLLRYAVKVLLWQFKQSPMSRNVQPITASVDHSKVVPLHNNHSTTFHDNEVNLRQTKFCTYEFVEDEGQRVLLLSRKPTQLNHTYLYSQVDDAELNIDFNL